jgi:hypothetical protein
MIKIFFKKNKYEEGYAILFTIVLISAISVIIAGLTSSTYKQLILSSLAKDSQIAFYQSDKASDCAFYADLVESYKTPGIFSNSGGTWTCGDEELTISSYDSYGSYDLKPSQQLQSSNDPCFNINVQKTPSADGLATEIKARGYNICNQNNPRVVEREIDINY